MPKKPEKKTLAKKLLPGKPGAKKPSRAIAKNARAELPGPASPAATSPRAKPPGGKRPGTSLPAVKLKTKVKPAVQKALARSLERDGAVDATVMDRLAATVMARRTADPAVSHSARLMSRGTAKVAQKFGEEAVECLIEAVEGNREALIGESADVLYHLIVLWVNAGVAPQEVWEELRRREGMSGIAEKARRRIVLPTTKIP